MAKTPTLKDYAQEYATLWDTMEIVRDAKVIESTAAKIIKFRAQYEEVEAVTNVPWYVVGIMDMREGGGGCCTHLHNGDSLKKPTVSVPAKRPKGNGPFTWQESACDALRLKGYDKIDAWTVEQMAFAFERYNGFGYRKKDINIPSPYLWGGTNHQTKGKYIADHVFSKTVLDPQIGCMPLLRHIAEKCDIELASQFGATAGASESSPASNRKAEAKPVGTVVAENAGAILKTVTGVAAVGGAAVSQTAPAPESKKPAPTAKEIIAKGQDVKAITEQARDLSVFGRDFVKVVTGDWMIGGLLALGVLVFAFPKIREKLSA